MSLSKVRVAAPGHHVIVYGVTGNRGTRCTFLGQRYIILMFSALISYFNACLLINNVFCLSSVAMISFDFLSLQRKANLNLRGSLVMEDGHFSMLAEPGLPSRIITFASLLNIRLDPSLWKTLQTQGMLIHHAQYTYDKLYRYWLSTGMMLCNSEIHTRF